MNRCAFFRGFIATAVTYPPYTRPLRERESWATKPLVVDGTIDPAEWKEALAISGLASQNPGGNQLIMRPTTYFMPWDADNLYVA